MSQGQPTKATSRAEQATATRAAVVAAARRLWAEKGFFATGTSEIVAAAGVGTRGALYHHFADREALFLAVFDAVHLDVAEALAPLRSSDGDPLERLRAVLLAFLEQVAARADVQALVVDAPAVLGWARWRQLEAERGLGGIEAILAEAMAVGAVDVQPLRPLAQLLFGLVNDAALSIASAADRDAAGVEFGAVVGRMIDGLRR